MTEARFRRLLLAAVGVGAVVRLAYVLTDDRLIIGGDGLAYHLEALAFADGAPYTSVIGDPGSPLAHHPPGWNTVLGIVAWLGLRSLTSHQLVTAAIGVGVVAVIGLVGRRWFTPRIGLLAAAIAAVYPGFWVLEGNVLSEPLSLLLLGAFFLVVPWLRARPSLGRAAATGLLVGLIALTRSELVAVCAVVVAVLLLRASELSLRDRWLRLGAVAVVAAVTIAPWSLYNSTRFEEPILLSTNLGGTLLSGNCPPATYGGEFLGWYDIRCSVAVAITNPDLDRSELDGKNTSRAFENMVDHPGDLPKTVAARVGRLVGVFRPTQTVELVAAWMGTTTWPIWLWVVSFWTLVPLAVLGAAGVRSRFTLLTFLTPAALAVAIVAVAYGEPRYHTTADLGIVVLAAVGVDRALQALGRAGSTSEAET